MANICETTISVVGLKEPPETFVKALSKAMFEIDLDDMDVEKWGCNKGEDGKFYQYIHVPPPSRLKDGFEYVDKPPLYRIPFTDGTVHEYVDAAHDEWKQARREVDPKTWYARLVEEQDIHLCILYPREPFVKCGFSVPRFYVETKWEPPFQQVNKASEAFPDLLFHVRWFIEQDGPSGEFVLKGGKLLERTESGASWYPRAADLTSREVQRYSDRELFWIVKNGVRLSGMPAFGNVEPDEHIWNLVEYVRTLPASPGDR